jgi:hypothetical protein
LLVVHRFVGGGRFDDVEFTKADCGGLIDIVATGTHYRVDRMCSLSCISRRRSSRAACSTLPPLADPEGRDDLDHDEVKP